jgi:hypothetical protein
MTNRRVYRAFKAWVSDRPGGIRGVIATVCLTAAAALTLSQALAHHAGSSNCQYLVGTGLRSDGGEEGRPFAEDLWRAEVSRQLEEILARIPGAAAPSHLAE